MGDAERQGTKMGRGGREVVGGGGAGWRGSERRERVERPTVPAGFGGFGVGSSLRAKAEDEERSEEREGEEEETDDDSEMSDSQRSLLDRLRPQHPDLLRLERPFPSSAASRQPDLGEKAGRRLMVLKFIDLVDLKLFERERGLLAEGRDGVRCRVREGRSDGRGGGRDGGDSSRSLRPRDELRSLRGCWRGAEGSSGDGVSRRRGGKEGRGSVSLSSSPLTQQRDERTKTHDRAAWSLNRP